MPLYSYTCPQCGSQREALIKHSELGAHSEYCEACEVVTEDGSVMVAADNLNEPDLIPNRILDVEGSRPQRWRLQRRMERAGAELVNARPDGKFQIKAVLKSGKQVEGTFQPWKSSKAGEG